MPMSSTSAPASAIPRAYCSAIAGADRRMSRAERDPQLAYRTAPEGRRARGKGASDAVRELLVHLIGVDAAEVVGLEDGLVHRACTLTTSAGRRDAPPRRSETLARGGLAGRPSCRGGAAMRRPFVWPPGWIRRSPRPPGSSAGAAPPLPRSLRRCPIDRVPYRPPCERGDSHRAWHAGAASRQSGRGAHRARRRSRPAHEDRRGQRPPSERQRSEGRRSGPGPTRPRRPRSPADLGRRARYWLTADGRSAERSATIARSLRAARSELDQLTCRGVPLLEECGAQGGLVLAEKLLVTSVHQRLADARELARVAQVVDGSEREPARLAFFGRQPISARTNARSAPPMKHANGRAARLVGVVGRPSSTASRPASGPKAPGEDRLGADGCSHISDGPVRSGAGVAEGGGFSESSTSSRAEAFDLRLAVCA